MAHARRAPQSIRQKLMDAVELEKELEKKPQPVRGYVSSGSSAAQASSRSTQLGIMKRPKLAWPMAASWIVTLGVSIYAWGLHQQLANWQTRVERLETSQQNTRELLGRKIAESKKRQQAIDGLFDPANKIVALQPAPKTTTPLHADICWNTRTHKIHLHVQELPPPPPGKQYQLWAKVDDRIQSLGVFRVSELTTTPKLMGRLSRVEGFLITLEAEGGSEQPSLQHEYAQGFI